MKRFLSGLLLALCASAGLAQAKDLTLAEKIDILVESYPGILTGGSEKHVGFVGHAQRLAVDDGVTRDHFEMLASGDIEDSLRQIYPAGPCETKPDVNFDPGRIRSVIPWGRVGVLPPPEPTVRRSATTGDAYGAMVITRPAGGVMLAETLVHEFQHSKLAALLHLFPLLDDDRAERYYAPWRADPRHLTGLLHGAYAFIGVTGFWRDRMSDGSVAPGTAAYYFALRRLQTRLVVRTLATSDRLTAPGRRLVAGLADTLDGWLREPVPDDALRRARTAAHLHRTEWRLRNLRPPRSSPRPTTAFWPDIRTHAFAVRPGVPRTADEFLAADDPEAATNRYARLDPVDPHVRAGRLVAYATLHPGRTGRRILARPESVRLPGSATPR